MPTGLHPDQGTKRSLTEDSDAHSDASTFQAGGSSSSLKVLYDDSHAPERPVKIPAVTPQGDLEPMFGLRECGSLPVRLLRPQGEESKAEHVGRKAERAVRWAPMRWPPARPGQ